MLHHVKGILIQLEWSLETLTKRAASASIYQCHLYPHTVA